MLSIGDVRVWVACNVMIYPLHACTILATVRKREELRIGILGAGLLTRLFVVGLIASRYSPRLFFLLVHGLESLFSFGRSGLIGRVEAVAQNVRIFVEASLDVASRGCGFIWGGEGSLVVPPSPISLLYLVSLPVNCVLS
jgi:hypothetical protein